MIDALIVGRLHGLPSQRNSRNDSIFCNAICFDERAQAALLALDAGEAVALAGELKVSTWTDKNGVTRPSLDLVASKALTQYHLTKRRRTMQAEHDGGQQRQPYRRGDYAPDPGELDDGRPLDF